MSCVSIIACASFCVSALMIIVSLSTDYWTHERLYLGPNKKMYEFHRGLWNACIESGSCSTIPINEVWFECVRAFVALGMVASVGTAITSVIRNTVRNVSKVAVYSIVILMGFLAAFFNIIAFIVYAAKMPPNDDTSHGWSFVIGWIAIIMDVIGVVMTAIFDHYDRI